MNSEPVSLTGGLEVEISPPPLLIGAVPRLVHRAVQRAEWIRFAVTGCPADIVGVRSTAEWVGRSISPAGGEVESNRFRHALAQRFLTRLFP